MGRYTITIPAQELTLDDMDNEYHAINHAKKHYLGALHRDLGFEDFEIEEKPRTLGTALNVRVTVLGDTYNVDTDIAIKQLLLTQIAGVVEAEILRRYDVEIERDKLGNVIDVQYVFG